MAETKSVVVTNPKNILILGKDSRDCKNFDSELCIVLNYKDEEGNNVYVNIHINEFEGAHIMKKLQSQMQLNKNSQ